MPRRGRRRYKNYSSNQQDTPNEDKISQTDSCLYHIKTSEKLGRYLVASSDLPEGVTVISEGPLVVGPSQDCPPVCLGCYKNLPNASSPLQNRCQKCQWPLCSSKCTGLLQNHGHSREECLTLSNCNFDNGQLAKNFLLNVIVPLRCLLLKEQRPEDWKTLLTMESHNNIRRIIPAIWDHNQKYVVDRITKEWKIAAFNEEEIHTICGILEVNAFSVGDESLNIRGVYPTASLLAHSCVANTAHIDDAFHLVIFTSVPVAKDEILTLTYTNTLLGTRERRKHLRQCKFFECDCVRCRDPTELGSFLSAVKCECDHGHLLPTRPLEDDCDWACTNKGCGRMRPAIYVHTLVERVSAAIQNLEQNNIEQLETSLKLHSRALHKNHYHMLGIKYSLSQLYGKRAGYLIHQMNEALLERKMNICDDILQAFNVVEPGLTRIRALTMYELHAPLMILTIKKFEMRKISKVELRRNLRKVASYLRDCTQILKFDSRSTSEGSIRIAAEEALSQLKSWEQVTGKL